MSLVNEDGLPTLCCFTLWTSSTMLVRGAGAGVLVCFVILEESVSISPLGSMPAELFQRFPYQTEGVSFSS